MTASICQSCAMPLMNEKDFGTNADHSKNREYCRYCFKHGAFTADCAMEEMIEHCVPHISNGNPFPDAEAARGALKLQFPALKRWNTSRK